jgi:hypothetical protein
MFNLGFNKKESLEQPRPIPCLFSNEDMKLLELEGWKVDDQVIDFNPENLEEWNKACDRANELMAGGEYDVKFVNGSDKKAGVKNFLYKIKVDKKI